MSALRFGLLTAVSAVLFYASPVLARDFFDDAFGSPTDGGGYIYRYAADIDAADRQREVIRIDHVCKSACTMKLGARNVCVTPDAEFHFHSAHIAGVMLSPVGNVWLRRYYARRPKILEWVQRHRALGSLSFTVMTGQEAISLGVPQCRDT